ncbi:unnamed protein product, partial [Ectocarpus sp. 8 AP-2014]
QLIAPATAKTYEISPGDDYEETCLKMVQPGDTCYFLSGDHKFDGLTRVHGTEKNRITLTGDSDACLKGSNTQDRLFQIAHDYYTVKNICFDGYHEDDDEYVSSAIYILGADKADYKDSNGEKASVTGTQLFDLEIKNFDEECIHFRYFVTQTEVSGCTVQRCGKHSFEAGGGGKVGEGIYIGTALDQVDDNKTPEPKLRTVSADNVDADVTKHNWIHHNTFRTYGNECVDIKEGSTENLVEYNICERQQDVNSACFGSRGSANTFRWNKISHCVGAGFRFGGDADYGADNDAYGNEINDAAYGAYKIMAYPQGQICGNKHSDIDEVFVGGYKKVFDSEAAIADCPDGSTPGDIENFSTSELPDDWDDQVVGATTRKDVYQHFTFTGTTTKYIKLTTNGNTFNNWSAFNEFEVCGEEVESNALFSGVRAAKKKLAQLEGDSVCVEPVKLAVQNAHVTDSSNSNNVRSIFDLNFRTWWASANTQNEDPMENAKIRLRFQGDQKVSYVKIAFFDGHLASYHMNLYKRAAADTEWTGVLTGQVVEAVSTFQTFTIEETGVNVLYIVGLGNDVGDKFKVSEVEVYGC